MPDFDVVELGPTDHPEAGDEAPDFTRPLVNDEFWEDRSLSELTDEGRVILIFTPMIASYAAKYVWDELTERGWNEGDARIVGVSASTPYAHSSVIADNDYPFELFADPANGVAERYGIAHDLDGMAGVSEPRTAFFAIDSDGVVEASWVATEWPEFPEYDDLEEQLDLV
ncbi:redoxin domain-containing protein [Halostagnicola sp. A-GB9-2]|uniref:redoxin domain-containing protein n=1 Tax=Halostagnicola sp. A-GB9-2 TaxID=3048066 RepID=UPI0024C06F8E|nr:redoxin domain-containing protein [Halostagnicola sp. A-GB9-2]MDJ1432820.1 redoxin domain-containing protein [Halostagnicola sp. A-GB9-2]